MVLQIVVISLKPLRIQHYERKQALWIHGEEEGKRGTLVTVRMREYIISNRKADSMVMTDKSSKERRLYVRC